MTFICYPKCSTCKKARAWLESQGFSFTERDIKAQPPTQEELREWHRRSGLPLKKFFNTSGQLYRAQGLSQKLPEMGETTVLGRSTAWGESVGERSISKKILRLRKIYIGMHGNERGECVYVPL